MASDTVSFDIALQNFAEGAADKVCGEAFDAITEATSNHPDAGDLCRDATSSKRRAIVRIIRGALDETVKVSEQQRQRDTSKGGACTASRSAKQAAEK
jgi:hypothetical protein